MVLTGGGGEITLSSGMSRRLKNIWTNEGAEVTVG